MARFAADPRGGRPRDPRVIGIALLIGLAALTRNEAIYVGFAWAIVVWTTAWSDGHGSGSCWRSPPSPD